MELLGNKKNAIQKITKTKREYYRKEEITA